MILLASCTKYRFATASQTLGIASLTDPLACKPSIFAVCDADSFFEKLWFFARGALVKPWPFAFLTSAGTRFTILCSFNSVFVVATFVYTNLRDNAYRSTRHHRKLNAPLIKTQRFLNSFIKASGNLRNSS